MVEARGGPRLALDPLSTAVLARDRLDRHLTLELLVPRQPDNAEAAGAEPSLEPVAPQDEPRARSARKRFCRVRITQRQGARLLQEAGLGTFCHRFRFRSLRGASCPPVILPCNLGRRLQAPGGETAAVLPRRTGRARSYSPPPAPWLRGGSPDVDGAPHHRRGSGTDRTDTARA